MSTSAALRGGALLETENDVPAKHAKRRKNWSKSKQVYCRASAIEVWL
jgi:hypothetical protein